MKPRCQRITNALTGDFVEISDRCDLAKDPAKGFLESCHGSRDVRCGCCGSGLHQPRLVVRKIGEHRYTLQRVRISDHSKDCVLGGEGGTEEMETTRTERILGPIDDEPPPDRQVGSGCLGSHGNYEDFGHYALGVLEAALCEAFVAASVKKGVPSNPAPDLVWSEIDHQIRHRPFVDGGTGYAVAQRSGCRLCFGHVFEALGESDDHRRVFDVYWHRGGLDFEVSVTRCVPGVLESALNGVRIGKIVRSPPYFALGVVNRDGLLQRLWIYQVLLTEDHFVPVESAIEADIAFWLLMLGAAFFKPIRMRAAVDALRRVGVSVPDAERLAFRPDFLCVWSRLLYIREVRGKERGKDPEYDLGLDTKGAHFRSLQPDRKRFYEEIDGVNRPLRWLALTPASWKSVRISRGSLPTSLFGGDA